MQQEQKKRAQGLKDGNNSNNDCNVTTETWHQDKHRRHRQACSIRLMYASHNYSSIALLQNNTRVCASVKLSCCLLLL
jgi:hypothetical protein